MKLTLKTTLAISGILIGSFIGAVAHATSDLLKADKPDSGFFADTSLLQLVNSPEGTKAFRYTSTKFDPSNYQAVIIDSVLINQSGVNDKITADTMEKTRATLEDGIKQKIGKVIALTDKAGPGTLKVNISISGADVAGEGFKLRNILPVSAVLKLASKAAGKDKKTAMLLIESKVSDSVSGELLKATMLTISSDSFRDQADADQELTALAKKVVDLAMKSISLQP
ncbi:Protein of unknown function DUF3313 [Methylophilaceae bacterium]|jgi:hypothetical protein